MNQRNPRTVFIRASAWLMLSQNLYQVAFPVFLWKFLKDRNSDSTQMLFSLLGFKFLIGFALDLVSSLAADLGPLLGLRRVNRRTTFLIGVGLQAVAFLILAVACWILIADPARWRAVIAVVLGSEVVRSISNALRSGVFDAWAVAALKKEAPEGANTDGLRRQMYVDARFWERWMGVVGAALALPVATLALWGPKNTGIWVWFWIAHWLGSAVLVGMLTTWLIGVMDDDDVTQFDPQVQQPQKMSASLALIQSKIAAGIRGAFAPRAMPAWLLSASTFTLAMLVGYCWPVLFNGTPFKEHSWAIVCSFLAASVLGGYRARHLASKSLSGTREAADTQLAAGLLMWQAVTVLSGATLVEIVARLGGDAAPIFSWQTFAVLIGLGLFSASRFFDFAALPFVSNLLQDHVSHPEMRSFVTSLRLSSASLFCSLIFLVITNVARWTSHNDPDQSVRWAAFALGLAILFVAVYLKTRARAAEVSSREVPAAR